MYEFHVSRFARDKYDFDQLLFKFDGNIIFANFHAARTFANKINKSKDLVNYPEQAIKASEINALGLIDEILHLIITLFRRQVNQKVFSDAYDQLEKEFGTEKLKSTLLRFIDDFPPLAVYQGKFSSEDYLSGESNGVPHTHMVLEEMLMLWLTNFNPAASGFRELFDDTELTRVSIYHQFIDTLKRFFKEQPHFGPDNQDLVTMLQTPAIEAPYSLEGQLDFIRRRWGSLIGEYLYRLLSSLDFIEEENKAIFTGPGPSEIPGFDFWQEDEENFSPDSDWMPKVVMLAKNAHVWLYQLSKEYGRRIQHLDEIPDEELDKLASWGFTGLWLIGLWERSDASKKIKQLCGNPDAVASAYSLRNYDIAQELGGDEAYQNLRERAWQRHIRLASDMVPNHMGIDSDWVVNHPDWFLSLPHSPFPSYAFNGPDLSPDDKRVGLFIEDHYYDRSDAAVVFKRVDYHTGDTRFIYHGNDGTSMPWNDTAQLNYLKAEVREAVVQTILHVARKFPIIRFDAAMTLAKKHYQRLWFPQPGTGGAIPSRSDHALTKEAFDEVFPKEFWREVVDRVASEVPDTLLLAEAFWLMEGYFVRTLGMHRVYNSAFMNMLRNEENAKYRLVIKNTLEFDPQILKRYVNFMNNPDEKTAAEQFGKGDKYFGICSMLSTMPGLPMFGHGQIEGYEEKYGMEYYRPYWEETPDNYLIQRHQSDIFPLLKHRYVFADVANFLIYDFYIGSGQVNEDVFAYSNAARGEHGLVIYNNRYNTTQGWIKQSCSYLNKETGELESRDIYDGLALGGGQQHFVIYKDVHSGLQYIRSSQEIKEKGLFFDLDAYKYHVLMDFREVQDNGEGQYAALTTYLNGRGVPSIEEALKELILAPVLQPINDLLNPESLRMLYDHRLNAAEDVLDAEVLSIHAEKRRRLYQAIASFTNANAALDPILNEADRGLEAILKLNVFEARYPFPGSKKYRTSLAFIQENFGHYPFIWYVLFVWNDLRLMGKVITQKNQYAEISRSWLEEWGILRHVAITCQELGLDEGQANSTVQILKLLTQQQLWVDQIHEKSPLMLVESWFSESEIRHFLNVNRHREKLWFNKEAFESMIWWLMTAALIKTIADSESDFSEMVEILFDAFEKIQVILKAEKESAYQVDQLLDALK